MVKCFPWIITAAKTAYEGFFWFSVHENNVFYRSFHKCIAKRQSPSLSVNVQLPRNLYCSHFFLSRHCLSATQVDDSSLSTLPSLQYLSMFVWSSDPFLQISTVNLVGNVPRRVVNSRARSNLLNLIANQQTKPWRSQKIKIITTILTQQLYYQQRLSHEWHHLNTFKKIIVRRCIDFFLQTNCCVV